MRNKYLAWINLASFLLFNIISFAGNLPRAYAVEFSRSADFLLEIGISLYDKGRFLEAMDQFRKVLLIDPNSMVAREFIYEIQRQIGGVGAVKQEGASRYLAMEEALDNTEERAGALDRLSFSEREKRLLEKDVLRAKKKTSTQTIASLKKEEPQLVVQRDVIALDETLRPRQANIALNLEMDSAVVIRGNDIKRFLNNTPERIEITRQDDDNLIIVAKGIGKGIFHIWDNSGRWTFDYTGKQKKIPGLTLDRFGNIEKPIGLSDPFKITYAIDWNSFNTGRRLDTTQRASLSIDQSVSVRGETPYGRFDSSATIERLNKEYELDDLTMGLTDGHIGKLEHINLRAFDFSTGIPAYKFPSADLRGVKINAPMFNNKFNYTAFWGGLPEGNYTRLSPGLGRTKEAYLEGIGLNYIPTASNKYKFYYAHTHGSELSQPVLTNDVFGVGSFHKIGNLDFNSEVAYDDNEHISYTTSTNLKLKKASIGLGFTEDDRDFASPFGGNSTGGSSTANMSLRYSPVQDLIFTNSAMATRDRSLYNPNDPKRPNYRYDSTMLWKTDPHTEIELGYTRDDTKGSISPALNQTKRLDIRKRVFFIKKLNTFFNYTNSTSKYFSGSTSNFRRNSFSAGMGFSVIGDLYYSINETVNFTEDTVAKDKAKSHVLDTALSYYSRIMESPFYGRFRVAYRDEEETESVISYLSGEDRLEFQAELDYRPNPFFTSYVGARVTNVWAEKESVLKHIDAEVRCGLRTTWDTGLRWNTKGHVQGFVFDDLNGDGIKNNEEQGVTGVDIIATTKKSDITNDEGYYLIKSIVGKKARVSMDLNTVPRGYTLTTPSYYDIDIIHGAYKRLDFGLTTRAEIVGVIFVDSDGNGQFDRGEVGLGGVVFILDDSQKIVTDMAGQYSFRNVSPGEHTISVDLKTLPTEYVPKVSIKKKITLDKGATFFNNIPLKQSSLNQ